MWKATIATCNALFILLLKFKELEGMVGMKNTPCPRDNNVKMSYGLILLGNSETFNLRRE
jgi:hypothetical protein